LLIPTDILLDKSYKLWYNVTMKVFKFNRRIFKLYGRTNEVLGTDFVEPKYGNNILCMRGVRRFFEIPLEARKVWITVRKRPAKGFVKVNSIISKNGPAVEIDGKKSHIYLETSRHLMDMNIHQGDVFYISVEYSLDK